MTQELTLEVTKTDNFVVNDVYTLAGKMQELNGYALQFGAFSQLKTAKDFAEKLAQKVDLENEKIYIQVSKSANCPLIYRVFYGSFKEEIVAENKQKEMFIIGYTTLIKGFK